MYPASADHQMDCQHLCNPNDVIMMSSTIQEQYTNHHLFIPSHFSTFASFFVFFLLNTTSSLFFWGL